MPGVTDTKFFERAGLMDTKAGTGDKDDPTRQLGGISPLIS
jgi:uncharacterized protein